MQHGIGIIGVGFGAEVLLPAFSKDPRCQVVALCAATQEKAEHVAKKHHIRCAFGCWKDLIDCPEVEVVAIAVPPVHQPEIILYALSRNKKVFAEKPVAGDWSNALKLYPYIGSRIAVDFVFPAISTWQKTKELLQQNRIGKLLRVAVTWRLQTFAEKHHLFNWKSDPQMHGGALNSFGSHLFYNLEWFLGRIRNMESSLESDPGRAEHSFQLNCLFESGITGLADVSTRDPKGIGHRWEFYGTQGVLVLENKPGDYVSGFSLSLHQKGGCTLLSQEPRTATDGRVGPVLTNISAFIDSIEGTPARFPNIAEALRVEELLHEAHGQNNRYSDSRIQRGSKYLLDLE